MTDKSVSQRQSYKNALMLAWLKANRPDVLEKIVIVLYKKYPIESVKEKFEEELAEIGK